VCVLWVAPDRATPGALAASLERRRLPWLVVNDGYAALADVLALCRQSERASASASVAPAGGQAANSGPVLVLVEPGRLDLAGLVMDALGRYRPSVAVWRYDARAHPVLARADRRELATVFMRTDTEERVREAGSSPEPAAQGATIGANGSPARSGQAQQPGQARAAGGSADGPAPASLLSDDELAMLLADSPRG